MRSQDSVGHNLGRASGAPPKKSSHVRKYILHIIDDKYFISDNILPPITACRSTIQTIEQNGFCPSKVYLYT